MKWIPKNKELNAFLNTGAKVTTASLNEQHAKVTAAVMAATEGDEYKQKMIRRFQGS